jgi:hypothetical protein
MDPLSNRSGFDRLYIGTFGGNLKARKYGSDRISRTEEGPWQLRWNAKGLMAGNAFLSAFFWTIAPQGDFVYPEEYRLCVLELRKNVKKKAADPFKGPTAQKKRVQPDVTRRRSLSSAIFGIMSRSLFFTMEPAMGFEPATY